MAPLPPGPDCPSASPARLPGQGRWWQLTASIAACEPRAAGRASGRSSLPGPCARLRLAPPGSLWDGVCCIPGILSQQCHDYWHMCFLQEPGGRQISALLQVTGAGVEQAQECPAIPAGDVDSEEQHSHGSLATRECESREQRGQGRAGCHRQTPARHPCLIKPEVLEVSAASKPGLTPPAKSPVGWFCAYKHYLPPCPYQSQLYPWSPQAPFKNSGYWQSASRRVEQHHWQQLWSLPKRLLHCCFSIMCLDNLISR